MTADGLDVDNLITRLLEGFILIIFYLIIFFVQFVAVGLAKLCK